VRGFRKIVGFLFAALGLLVLGAGAVLAFGVVGSDDTITMRAKDFSSAGVAVVTAPELLSITNATLKVDLKASDSARPVFVGVAHEDDVTSYFAGNSYTQLQTYAPPDTLTMAQHPGANTPVAVPTGLDWWVAKGTGNRTASLAWPMSDDKVVLVVMNADGKPSLKTTADVGLEVKGAFTTSLLGTVGGLLLLSLGSAMVFGRRKAAEGTNTQAPVRSDRSAAPDSTPSPMLAMTPSTTAAMSPTTSTSNQEMGQ